MEQEDFEQKFPLSKEELIARLSDCHAHCKRLTEQKDEVVLDALKNVLEGLRYNLGSSKKRRFFGGFGKGRAELRAVEGAFRKTIDLNG